MKTLITLLNILLLAIVISCSSQPGTSGGSSGGGNNASSLSSQNPEVQAWEAQASSQSSGSSSSVSSSTSSGSGLSGSIIYVAKTGDDNNPGTKTSPMKTIQEAINKAAASGFTGIYAATGVYKNGDGLLDDGQNGMTITNNNLQIIGGWNNTFTSQTGYSELDGQKSMFM